MSQTVIVRLTSNGYNITGPFKVSDDLGNVLSESIPYTDIYIGKSYTVVDEATSIVLQSLDNCNIVVCLPIQELTHEEIYGPVVKSGNTGTLWRHLTNTLLNNTYYDKIEPYIIEYPVAYQFQDEILQNVRDFTVAYKYLPIPDGVYNDNAKIQTDDQYFNKVIIYNGQQCSGLLELVKKPMNNLAAYNQYPIYNANSKTILYTKSGSFYQYNTFWNVVVDKEEVMFNTTCESLSIDKVLNQDNMDYGLRSFRKDPFRAKGVKIRHILDNRSDAHLVSQFVLSPSQISYK
jgi:hypothetical protein